MLSQKFSNQSLSNTMEYVYKIALIRVFSENVLSSNLSSYLSLWGFELLLRQYMN